MIDMSFENAKRYVESQGFGNRIMVFEQSSATVELAAAAVGTESARIAKSLTFQVDEKPVMILCAGDVKIDNSKFKKYFHQKAKMLSPAQVQEWIGHTIGGVCPFGINDGVTIYLDESLKRFDVVYPACGSGNSAVKLSVDELDHISGNSGWVDVCKLQGNVQ